MSDLDKTKVKTLAVHCRARDAYIDLQRETPTKERWITKRAQKPTNAERLKTELAKVAVDILKLNKNERTAILAECGLQELPESISAACNQTDARIKLRSHALPKVESVDQMPNWTKRVANLTPEELAARRSAGNLRAQKWRAKKAGTPHP